MHEPRPVLGILRVGARVHSRKPVPAEELLLCPMGIRDVERAVREIDQVLVNQKLVRASLNLQILDDIASRLSRVTAHIVLYHVVYLSPDILSRAVAVRCEERTVNTPQLMRLQVLLTKNGSVDAFTVPPYRRRRAARRAAGGRVKVSLCAG